MSVLVRRHDIAGFFGLTDVECLIASSIACLTHSYLLCVSQWLPSLSRYCGQAAKNLFPSPLKMATLSLSRAPTGLANLPCFSTSQAVFRGIILRTLSLTARLGRNPAHRTSRLLDASAQSKTFEITAGRSTRDGVTSGAGSAWARV